MKVAAGSGRANDIIKLPGGDLIHVKVTTQDSGGALFMTEQPIERRGFGPPKHYHEEQDEWFYCLAGEYVVEIGDQRCRLGPGDSVLGPRRVPHAFVYDGAGPGRILIGFTPAVRIEQFFRDLEKRGEYFGNGTPEDKELVHRLVKAVALTDPDVVLVDVCLPTLNGLEACQHIKRLSPHAKVIVLSASDDPGIQQRAVDFGASAFVPKYRIARELEAAIARALSQPAPASPRASRN